MIIYFGFTAGVAPMLYYFGFDEYREKLANVIRGVNFQMRKFNIVRTKIF